MKGDLQAHCRPVEEELEDGGRVDSIVFKDPLPPGWADQCCHRQLDLSDVLQGEEQYFFGSDHEMEFPYILSSLNQNKTFLPGDSYAYWCVCHLSMYQVISFDSFYHCPFLGCMLFSDIALKILTIKY